MLENAGCPTKVERGERVFPLSDKSSDVIKTFEKISNKVWDSEKIAIIFDHNVPANTIGSAEFQKVCRNFINEQNITKNFIHGEGICHQVVPEMGLVEPGKVIVGADYDFSKRTSALVSAGWLKEGKGANQVQATAGLVGLRHKF